MRVRHLQSYYTEATYAAQSAIQQLQHTRVGIDAVVWIRSLQSVKDPLAEVVGGLPAALFSIIFKELHAMSGAGIHPIFVFDGIVPPWQHEMFQQGLNRQKLDDGWNCVAQSKMNEAQRYFSQGTSRISNDLTTAVFHFLKARGCECLRAPYLAGPQLSALAAQGYIGAVYGSPGMLLYGVRRVITNIDLANQFFEWMDIDTLCNGQQINFNQFVDACLLSGTEYSLTYPYLIMDRASGQSSLGRTPSVSSQAPDAAPKRASSISGSSSVDGQGDRESVSATPQMPGSSAGGAAVGSSVFSFQKAVDCIKSGSLLHWLTNEFPLEQYKKPFCESVVVAKTIMLHCPVLNVRENRVTSFCCPVPADAAEVFGERLPPQVYALLCSGMISPRLPSVLAIGEWTDRQPPIVDTMEHRSLLLDLVDYRGLALGILSKAIVEASQSVAGFSGPSALSKGVATGTGTASSSTGSKISLPSGRGVYGRPVTNRLYFETTSSRVGDGSGVMLGSAPAVTVVPKVPESVTSRMGLVWNVTLEKVNAERSRQRSDSTDLGFALRWFAKECDEALASGANHLSLLAPPAQAQSVRSALLAIANHTMGSSKSGQPTVVGYCSTVIPTLVNLHFLDALGYVAPDGGPTVLSDALREVPHKLTQPLFVALELMKFGLLTGDPLTAPSDKPFPPALKYGSSHDRAMTMLLRVMSLCPVRLTAESTAWIGKVSFDLCAFHCVLRTLLRTLRLIYEACTAQVLLSDSGDSPYAVNLGNLPQYMHNPYSYGQGAPTNEHAAASMGEPLLEAFQQPRTCAGIIAATALEYQVPSHSRDNPRIPFNMELRRQFPAASDPLDDFVRAAEFWTIFKRTVDELNGSAPGMEHIYPDVCAANDILTRKLVELDLQSSINQSIAMGKSNAR